MREAGGDLIGGDEVGRPRVAPSKHQAPLTPRDLLVFEDLREFRYLSTAQVARLRFGNLKLAQRRMRSLVRQGHVVRVPCGELARHGFRDAFFALPAGGASARGSATGDRAPGTLSDPRRGFGIRYAAHHRLLTDVRIWLREAAASSGGGLACRFVPPYAGARVDGQRSRLIAVDLGPPDGVLLPDGVFELRASTGRAALFFLEVDRGTEPLRGRHPSSIRRKLEAYRRLYDGRSFDRFGNFFDYDYAGFRVLFVTPDDDRATRILEVALAVDLAPLVWATAEATLRGPGSFFACAWRDAPDSTPRSLAG